MFIVVLHGMLGHQAKCVSVLWDNITFMKPNTLLDLIEKKRNGGTAIGDCQQSSKWAGSRKSAVCNVSIHEGSDDGKVFSTTEQDTRRFAVNREGRCICYNNTFYPLTDMPTASGNFHVSRISCRT